MVDSEFALIRAIAAGDHQAFERLVRRYQNPLFNFIYRYLGDRSAAEDVSQEVFLRVYRAAPRFEPRARVSSWVFKIAYNLCMNELKRGKRVQTQLRDVYGRSETAPMTSSVDGQTQDDMHEEVMAALAEMPENQRAALLLRINEQLSYREISEIMQTSVASVESLLFRARKHLRDAMRKG